MSGTAVLPNRVFDASYNRFGIIGTIANGGGLAVDVTMGGGGPSGGGGASCDLCELDGPMRGGDVESLVWTTFFDGEELATG